MRCFAGETGLVFGDRQFVWASKNNKRDSREDDDGARQDVGSGPRRSAAVGAKDRRLEQQLGSQSQGTRTFCNIRDDGVISIPGEEMLCATPARFIG